jgi:glutamate carboxypeptidase
MNTATTSTYLTTHLPDYLDDLATLVNRDCGTSYKTGVDEVADWVGARLHALGASVERRQVADYGDQLLGRWTGRGKGRVLLSAHLDTVYPIGTAAARPLRQEGDRLLGPGVTDMKGGLLGGLWAIAALLAQGWDDFGEIAYIFSSEEELGSPVSKEWLAALAPHYDAGLVMEAGRENGNLVYGRKGGGLYELHIQGRSAHAGVEPERGASAFLELCHRALAIDRLNGTIPGATLVIGQARAGTVSNAVPDTAWATVDCRVVDPAGAAALAQALQPILDAPPTIPGTQLTVTGGLDRDPWPITPAGERLFALAQRLAADLGFQVGAQTSGGTSDANFLAGAGLPCLDALGPIGGDDHSPREWLLIPSIVPRTTLTATLVQTIGSGAFSP